MSWQNTPRALNAALTDPDRAAAKRAFNAMMEMGKIDIAAVEVARQGCPISVLATDVGQWTSIKLHGRTTDSGWSRPPSELTYPSISTRHPARVNRHDQRHRRETLVRSARHFHLPPGAARFASKFLTASKHAASG